MKKLGYIIIGLTLFLTTSAFNTYDMDLNDSTAANVDYIEYKNCAEAAAGFLNDYEAIAGGCLNANDYNSLFTMVEMYCEIMM